MGIDCIKFDATTELVKSYPKSYFTDTSQPVFKIAIKLFAILILLIPISASNAETTLEIDARDIPTGILSGCLKPALQKHCLKSSIPGIFWLQKHLDQRIKTRCIVGAASRGDGFPDAEIGCLGVGRKYIRLGFSLDDWTQTQEAKLREHCQHARSCDVNGELRELMLKDDPTWQKKCDRIQWEVSKACTADITGTLVRYYPGYGRDRVSVRLEKINLDFVEHR
jgi:hypothetical protein